MEPDKKSNTCIMQYCLFVDLQINIPYIEHKADLNDIFDTCSMYDCWPITDDFNTITSTLDKYEKLTTIKFNRFKITVDNSLELGNTVLHLVFETYQMNQQFSIKIGKNFMQETSSTRICGNVCMLKHRRGTSDTKTILTSCIFLQSLKTRTFSCRHALLEEVS